jgi:hypothetical protein
MTDRVYVHIIEMTVFDEEAYERPYVMLDRQVDIVCVTKEPLSYQKELDVIEQWFKYNPFGFCGLGEDRLEYATKLINGEEHVYTHYTGDKAVLSLTTYKQELMG